MTKIVIDRKTVEQALEALDVYYSKAEHRRTKDDESKASEAITALRTALAPPTCNHQWLSSGMHPSYDRCIVCGKVKDRPEWGIGHAEQRRTREGRSMKEVFVRPRDVYAKFKLGDTVKKVKGSQWHGTVVGTYSTSLTPEGYAVENKYEAGSVQIYPAAALEKDE